MFLNRWKCVMACTLFIAVPALAADRNDQLAYCSYVMEQAQAQRDLLRTPVASAGFSQPDQALPMQVVAGASVGLSDIRKASLTMDAARKNCELSKATTGAQQDVQYALSSLEKEALRNRLSLIELASKSLDALMEKTSRMVEAQNATRLMLFSLQTTMIKLDADRTDTESKIAALYTPLLSDKPLKELVAEKLSTEANEQRALDKLNRQNNWDVALSVGVHQQVNPIAQTRNRTGRSRSTTISRAGPSTSTSIALWKHTANGKRRRRAMLYATRRSFTSNYWIAFRRKKPNSNHFRQNGVRSTRISSWSAIRIPRQPSTSPTN